MDHLTLTISNQTKMIFNNTISLNYSLPINPDVVYTLPFLIYNSSFPILNNVLYYVGNGTWFVQFTNLNESGYYAFGLTAIDVYNNTLYLPFSIQNDLTTPTITFNSPQLYNPYDSNTNYTMTQNQPFITFDASFNENISYIQFWVTNATGGNVFEEWLRAIVIRP